MDTIQFMVVPNLIYEPMDTIQFMVVPNLICPASVY